MITDIVENFKSYFPSVEKHATSYRKLGDFELVVYCDDGDRLIYDDFDKSIRSLPPSDDVMTEEIWRREFGLKLRKLIARKGVTQLELANMVGISQTMLSNYINGRCMPGFYIVDKLARALECSIDDLRYI